MTEALKTALGEGVYNTLAREVGIRHPEYISRTPPPPYRQDPVVMITAEGVKALADWTVEDFDDLHAVGPERARMIFEAVQALLPNT